MLGSFQDEYHGEGKKCGGKSHDDRPPPGGLDAKASTFMPKTLWGLGVSLIQYQGGTMCILRRTWAEGK